MCRLARGDKMRLLGSWERMHLSSAGLYDDQAIGCYCTGLMATRADAGAQAGISPPEPDLTPQQMIDRAVGLRPLLRDQSAETEQRTCPSDEIHQACVDAGFYRLYIPRRYGGYEFGAPTFMRVV